MGTITIDNRSFEAPVLVPSVSSFETQLPPVDALRLQYTLHEPISLVSAYDVFHDDGPLRELCQSFRNQGVLLLDSGGYESSRISHHAREPLDQRWDFAKYKDIARLDELYDLIFSFDYFLAESDSVDSYAQRLLISLRAHSDVLDIFKLIPVIHVRSSDGEKRLKDDEIEMLFARIASEIDCRFIAIPERELGDGIIARAALTRKISRTITSNSSDECHLHVLGCGNLLSFSLLSISGAIMCDGLEWCRTLAAGNFHLHHFQQQDLFADPDFYAANPAAEFIVNGARLDYSTSVAVRNLLSFQAFTRLLHDRLSANSVHEFVGEYFGDTARNATQALEK